MNNCNVQLGSLKHFIDQAQVRQIFKKGMIQEIYQIAVDEDDDDDLIAVNEDEPKDEPLLVDENVNILNVEPANNLEEIKEQAV